MDLDYVDVFYSHRPDLDTDLAETIGALDTAVRQGKALYARISSYRADRTQAAAAIAHELHLPLVIHQPSYSIFDRWIETDGLLDACEQAGIGCVVFSPLAQGLLSDRYLRGIPEGSSARRDRRIATMASTAASKNRSAGLTPHRPSRGTKSGRPNTSNGSMRPIVSK